MVVGAWASICHTACSSLGVIRCQAAMLVVVCLWSKGMIDEACNFCIIDYPFICCIVKCKSVEALHFVKVEILSIGCVIGAITIGYQTNNTRQCLGLQGHASNLLFDCEIFA